MKRKLVENSPHQNSKKQKISHNQKDKFPQITFEKFFENFVFYVSVEVFVLPSGEVTNFLVTSSQLVFLWIAETTNRSNILLHFTSDDKLFADVLLGNVILGNGATFASGVAEDSFFEPVLDQSAVFAKNVFVENVCHFNESVIS